MANGIREDVGDRDDAEAGETLTVASQRSNWSTAEDFPAIPDAEWHAVRVRVVVERYENGNTTEGTALETMIRPAIALDRHIHSATCRCSGRRNYLTRRRTRRSWQCRSQREGLVALPEDWQEVCRRVRFRSERQLKPDLLKPKSTVKNLGERGGSLFGGFDGIERRRGRATSSLTAEWIDYEILVPGEASKRLRRPIFDLLGPASRSAKSRILTPPPTSA